jgi:hypothetical protein
MLVYDYTRELAGYRLVVLYSLWDRFIFLSEDTDDYNLVYLICGDDILSKNVPVYSGICGRDLACAAMS